MGFLGLILVGTPKRSAKRRILVIELRTMAGRVVLLLLPPSSSIVLWFLVFSRLQFECIPMKVL